MIKFEFRKEKIVTSPQFYLFKEFTDIWKWDKTPGKPRANKLLFFVFLLCDLSEDNPLRDVPAESKEEEALYRAYGSKTHSFTKRERSLVEPAILCYIRYNKTPEERILEAFDSKAIELREELEVVKPETYENFKDGVTTFVSNSSIITKGLKELDAVKKLKMNVINAIRREAMSQRVRGAAVLSPLSKGNINLFSEAEKYVEYEVDGIQGESESGQIIPENGGAQGSY
jgi:hypothetical protein